MTISSTQTRISYNGNGITTEFSFPFLFPLASDLQLRLVASTGAVTLLILNTNYTVTGAGDDSGGAVTLNVAPAVGERLVINRILELTQEIDYITGDPFPAQTHERGLDRLTMLVQQHDERLDRTLQLPVTSGADAALIDPEAVEVVAGIADDVIKVAVIEAQVVTVASVAANVATVASIAASVTTVAGNTTNINAVADNNDDVTIVATNINDIKDAPAAATSANDAAIVATTAAAAAEASASSINIPNSLIGRSSQFLRVKQDETGYELVISVAAPTFFGINLSPDGTELLYTTGTDDYNTADFTVWAISDGLSFDLDKNNLVINL